MGLFLPHWFANLDPDDPDDARIRNKFFVRSAALVHNPDGGLRELADAMGVSVVTLYNTFSPNKGRISPELAVKLERAVGADVLPRSLLRPDIFY